MTWLHQFKKPVYYVHFKYAADYNNHFKELCLKKTRDLKNSELNRNILKGNFKGEKNIYSLSRPMGRNIPSYYTHITAANHLSSLFILCTKNGNKHLMCFIKYNIHNYKIVCKWGTSFGCIQQKTSTILTQLNKGVFSTCTRKITIGNPRLVQELQNTLSNPISFQLQMYPQPRAPTIASTFQAGTRGRERSKGKKKKALVSQMYHLSKPLFIYPYIL